MSPWCWGGAPDGLAVFGIVLTLLRTDSPLLKHGPELGQWIIRWLTWRNPRYRGEITFGAAALAIVGVLLCWESLPALGPLSNDRGTSALAAGDLVAAAQWFQRASAVRPELLVPYSNLAEVYAQRGAPRDQP